MSDFWSKVEKYRKQQLGYRLGLDDDEDAPAITAGSSSSSSSENDFWSKVAKYQEENSVWGSIYDDVAPLRTSQKKKEEEEEDDSLLDFFQKGAFDDGYQFGDVTKSILGTVGDAGLSAFKGFAQLGEGVGDLVNYGIAGVADAIGKDDFADDVRKRTQENMVEHYTEDVSDFLNQYSVLGRTSDAIFEGVGQVGSVMLTGGLGSAAGLGTKAVTGLTTGLMGVSGMGSGMSEAYKGGATDEEAATYGAIAGTADALTELIFGGMGKAVNATGLSFGLSSADDILAKKVSGLFTSQIAKNIAEYGIKAGAEGFEEVLAGIAQGVGKKLTYMEEEELSQILKDENLLEQFVVGAVTSGIAQVGDLQRANTSQRDFISGMSQNEQAVVDKEYQSRIAEAEKNGTLTAKEKNKLYDSVVEDMENGFISIDTIEEVLGGDTFKSYQDTVKSEDDLVNQEKTLTEESKKLEGMVWEKMTGEQQVRRDELRSLLPELRSKIEEQNKNSKRSELKKKLDEEVFGLVKSDRLVESYNERTRKTQAFTADLNKYDAKQQAVIQKAIDSGILNNTNKTHKLVDFIAKISADKGVSFNFTNNAKLKESGFAIDGKQVNGFVNKDGITLNIQSAKYLESVVGHEVAHVLEGTELYAQMQSAVFEYAKSKKDYDGRLEKLQKLYEGVEGANIEAELTADLVGDYLFQDSDFINKLSTENRNVFQKIFDEVKYLLKVATAGSQEARKLEKVKRAFEKAYRETKNTADSGAKYSIREDIVDVNGKEYDTVVELDKTVSKRTLSEPKKFLSYIEKNLVGLKIPVTDSSGNIEVIEFAGANETVTKNKKRHPVLGELAHTKGDTRKQVIVNAKEVIEESAYDPEYSSADNEHGWLDRNGWESRKTYVLTQGGMLYEAYLKIAKAQDGRNILYAVNLDINKGIAVDQGATSKKAAVLAAMPSGDNVAQEGYGVKGKFSISDSNEIDTGIDDDVLLDDLELFLDDTDFDWDEILGTKWISSLGNETEEIAPTKAESEPAKVEDWLPSSPDEIKKMYQEAIDRGDIPMAQRIVDEVARRAGYTEKAYHGTGEQFNSFSEDKISGRNVWGKGYYFGASKSLAEDYAYAAKRKGGNSRIVSAYLKMENPYIVRESQLGTAQEILDKWFPDMWKGAKKQGIGYIEGKLQNDPHDLLQFMASHNGIEIRDVLAYYGYDSIKAYDELVVFSPEQIKSSDPVTFDDDGNWIPVSERFNAENNDIRYSLSDTNYQQAGSNNASGKDITEEQNETGLDAKSEVKYSLSHDTEYMDKASELNNTLLHVSSDAMVAAKAVRGRIASRMNEIKDRGLVGLPEDIEGNTYIANSSYDGTEENTTICPRSLASEAFTDAVSEYLGRPLTVEEQIYISQDLQGRSLTPECTYCYVATDRKAYRAFLGEYINQRDAVLRKVKENPGADISRKGDLYKEFLNGRKDTNPMYSRFKMWVDTYKSGKPTVEASHLANINKLMGDINSAFGAELKQQIVDAMKYAQSASWAKKRVNYVAYNGHILKWKQSRIDKLNSHYGLRMYSFSDFHPAFVLENMQMITDASVRGLKMLGYTKDTDFVEIFAPTGMNINVSTFGFETGGNVYENNIIGAEWERAKTLREQYPNVGITFVATNDHLVNWALDQDWIDVVIPYHLVRTGVEVAKAFGYTNYTSESSDTKDAGWAKGKDQKYIAPTEHNNDKATYLAALKENHLNPRFARFIDNPNYMKLVNESRQPASKSKPVQPVFNEDAAMVALAKLEANGYYQPIGGSVDRMYEIAAEVANDMTKQLAPVVQNSLSDIGSKPVQYGNHATLGSEIAYTPQESAEVAPVAENDTNAVESTVEELFPDDTAPWQEEYEFLLAERDDIAGAIDAYAAAGDLENAEKLWPEYQRVQERIAAIEGDESDRLASIDEADAPPETDNSPEDVADNVPLTKTLITELAKNVRSQLGLPAKRVAEVREIIERYSAEEFPSKAHLYTEIAERFGTYTEKYVDEDLKGVKSLLRTAGISVDESIKRDIADYGQLMKSNFGKVRFAKDGLPVDVAYKEFQEVLPGYFPESIYVPADQLMRIIEVANAETTMETEYEIDWQTLEAVTDSIMNGVAEFKQNRKETLANQFARESFNSLMETADQYVPPVPENTAPARTRPAIQSDPDDIAPVFDTSSGQQALMPEVETPKRLTRKDLHFNIMNDIKTTFREKGLEFDDVLKNAKDLSTFATVDNTPQRVLEKALGYKQGQVLGDMTVNKVAQNETQGIRWLNSFTDKKTGLLAKISKQYGIKPGSKASAAAQMYAEGFYVGENDAIIAYGDRELAADFPNAKVQENIKKLARDPRIRQIYDETLAAINESRTRNAYPEIPRLDNYFLHFRAMEDTFSRLGLPFNPNDIRAKDLPTDLNGVTADLKPGQPYFASAMHRKGKRTSFDLLGGLEKYLTSAKNQIYHIDDIQTLRALRNYVAETYGQAHGLEDLDLLSDEEAEQRIQDVYNSHLSTFAKFLNEEANVLAGKTSLIDRGLEGVIGRRGITFLDTLNKQVGANMVGFNVSSSLTNLIAPIQAFAKSNKFDFVKAMAQTASNKIGSVFGHGDTFVEDSPVMIRRKGAERFYRTPYEKVADTGYVFMSMVDNLSTELIARTKYNELTRKGMDSQKAHYETDKWVSRLMGDRSLGQQPQLYNSKMLGLFTKFQLEVRNQLDSQFYDTIQEAKVSTEEIENGLLRNAKKAAKITSTFAQLAVLQHVFGKAFESVAGYNPAFDIIEALVKAFGWDDEEDDEDTVLDNIEEGFLSLLGDLPYTSTLTGGRIPIASALPVTEFIKGEDQYGNEKSRWETLREAAPYYLLPGGYGQVKKTIAGMKMFDEELPVSGSYTDSGNLRFPVEDTLGNRIQAGLFGQWASENARDYFNNERKPLKENQIEEFLATGMQIQDYWDYREGLSEHDALAEKVDYIESLDLPVSTKNILVNNLTDRKEPIDMENYDAYSGLAEMDFATKNPEKYDFLISNNVSYSDYVNFDETTKDAWTWAYENPDKFAFSKAITDDVVEYRKIAGDLYNLKADKDQNGKSINGSRKEKVFNYISGLDVDAEVKMILFKSEYPSFDDYNYEIAEYLNSREDISYQDALTILRELGFNVSADGTIRW